MAKVTKISPPPAFVLELTVDELVAVSQAAYTYGMLYSNEVRARPNVQNLRGIVDKRTNDVLQTIRANCLEACRGD